MSPAKKAILAVGLPLGLAAAGGFAVMTLTATPVEPTAVPDPTPGQHGILMALEERVVNLQAGGSYRYAKVGVTVELRPESADFYGLAGEARVEAEREAVAGRETATPLLLDALGSVVSAQTSAELNTTDGRGTLKAQLLEAFRHVLGEEEVIDLYFTDLVMQ